MLFVAMFVRQGSSDLQVPANPVRLLLLPKKMLEGAWLPVWRHRHHRLPSLLLLLASTSSLD